MHALGNDFVFFDCFSEGIENPAALAVKVCDRRKGIGADGVVTIEKSEIADAAVRIYNADGSEAETCGNGLRCAAKLLYDTRRAKRKEIVLETLSGVRRVRLLFDERGEVTAARAEMGTPIFSAEKIPVSLPATKDGKILRRKKTILGERIEITCVSIGNPHCVTFSENAYRRFDSLGKALSEAAFFPRGANTEFVRINGENDFFVRVYERGCGETFSCGSGACAVVAAAIEAGFAKRNSEATVRTAGGTLRVTEEVRNGKNVLYLTGEAKFSFKGKIEA